MTEVTKTEYVVINESVPKSVFKDTFSTASIIIVVYFSWHFDSALFAFFGLLLLLGLSFKFSKKYKDKNSFNSIDETIERLQKMKEEG